MRYVLRLLLVLGATTALMAQIPDSTSFRPTDFPEPDTLDVTPFQGVRAFLDPVSYATERAFSFRRFSSLPGEIEPYHNIRYNLADGLFLGLGSDTRRALWFDSSVLVHGGFGYAFGSHYWQAFGGVDKRFGQRENATLIGVEGHTITDSYDSWRSAAWENSLLSVLSEKDARNWFRRSGWSARLEQYTGMGLTASVQYAQDMYEFLPKDSWSLLQSADADGANGHRKSFVFEPAQTRAVIVAIAYVNMPRLRGFGDGFRAHVQTEVGTQTDTYNRTLAEVAWYRPLWPAVTWNVRLRLGAATGDVIVPKLFTLGGYGSLPAFRWSEYTGNRMALLNTEILLHPAPFSLNRLWSSISFVLLANAGYTSVQEAGASPLLGLFPTSTANWHSDIGLAVGSRNGSALVGIVWRTDTGEAAAVTRFSHTF